MRVIGDENQESNTVIALRCDLCYEEEFISNDSMNKNIRWLQCLINLNDSYDTL